MRAATTRESMALVRRTRAWLGSAWMSGATASRTRHRQAADRRWLAQRCSREGCAVEHLDGVDGGLVAQHRRSRARGVHIREHQERRRLQPGHYDSVCRCLKTLTTLLSTLMMLPSCKPGMRTTYRPGLGGRRDGGALRQQRHGLDHLASSACRRSVGQHSHGWQAHGERTGQPVRPCSTGAGRATCRSGMTRRARALWGHSGTVL